jgi:hypothetical protein
MQNAADNGASVLPEHHKDGISSVMSELAALLGHVQTSMRAIETTIAHDASSASSRYFDNAIVLDDVTPRYARAAAALSACNISLHAALQFLLQAETSASLTKSAPRLVRLSGRG